MAGRPRRTRIYGANYNIGESYYKSALDNLDRKQFGTTSVDTDPVGILKPSRNIDSLLQPTSILSKTLHDDEPLYEYTPREPTFKSHSVFDDEPEEDEFLRSSVKRLSELKRAVSPAPTSSFLDDYTAIKERNKANTLEISRLPRMKPIYDLDDLSTDLGTTTSDIFKSSTAATSASSRANATKERLSNLEFEMSERFDKQIQREKRSENLKKFMSETGVEVKSVKKVTF